MGRRNKQRKNAAMLDSDDDISSVSSSSSLARSDRMSASGADNFGDDLNFEKDFLLEQALDALYEKRGSTREKALASIIDAFCSSLQYQFIEKNFATLLHQCLNCVKKGSSKEIALACHSIGLLALTVGYGDNAREMLEESITPLTQALKTTSDPSRVTSLVECLAILNFVGGSDSVETEQSMQAMWHIVRPKLGSNVVLVKPSNAVVVAVVSSWTLVLTSMDEPSAESTWLEALSFFSNLLEKDDRSSRIAAGEAIAVIFEMGILQNSAQHVHGWKSKILSQVVSLASEAGGKGSAKKDLTNQRSFFKDVLEYLEDGYSPEVTVKVGGDSLRVSTWRHLMQLNYLKRFLSGGFIKHVQENEFIRDLFELEPKKRAGQGGEPGSVKQRSPYAAMRKARTQHLNKQRMLSEGMNIGHFAVNSLDED